MSDQQKRIGISSKNTAQLLKSLETSLNIFYKFEEVKDGVDYDLVIIESQNPFEELMWLKNRNLLKERTPCLLISNDKAIHSRQLLTETQHSGAISILRNYYGDYTGVNDKIRTILKPNLPVKKSKYLFVIPIFNEENRLKNVFDFLNILIKIISTQNLDASIRFVNDGSDDNSPELINKLLPKIQKEMGNIPIDQFLELENLVENTKKAGIYQAGFKNSDANYFFILDSDNSFFEEDIVKAISIIEDGYYDVIQATKDLTSENRPLIRRALSFCKRLCTYFFLPPGIVDSQTGFKLINATVAKHSMPYIRNEYGFAADLQLLNICKQMKFRALQLPVKCIDRDGSHVDPIADTKRYISSLLKIALKKEVYHEFK